MKNFLVVLFLSVAVVSVQADEQPEQIVLTQTVNASFGKVWDAIKEAMTEFGCPKPQTDKVIEPVEETGFYKGVYVSDFCIIVTGEDSTRDKMEQYGEIPRVRGGIWITGRVQYKVNVKEEGVRNTKITLRAELSGFEEFITNQVYFWTSNGILEKKMMENIIAKIQSKTDAPESNGMDE